MVEQVLRSSAQHREPNFIGMYPAYETLHTLAVNQFARFENVVRFVSVNHAFAVYADPDFRLFDSFLLFPYFKNQPTAFIVAQAEMMYQTITAFSEPQMNCGFGHDLNFVLETVLVAVHIGVILFSAFFRERIRVILGYVLICHVLFSDLSADAPVVRCCSTAQSANTVFFQKWIATDRASVQF